MSFFKNIFNKDKNKKVNNEFYKNEYSNNRIKSLENDIIRSDKTGIKKMEIFLMDKNLCAWCTSLEGKIIPLSVTFIDEIRKNCTCERLSIGIKPIVDFSDL